MSEYADTFVLVLKRPLKEGEQVWTELSLCEPTIGQVRQAGREAAKIPDSDPTIELIRIQTGVPSPTLKQMLISDHKQADDFFGHFVATSPTAANAG